MAAPTARLHSGWHSSLVSWSEGGAFTNTVRNSQLLMWPRVPCSLFSACVPACLFTTQRHPPSRPPSLLPTRLLACLAWCVPSFLTTPLRACLLTGAALSPRLSAAEVAFDDRFHSTFPISPEVFICAIKCYQPSGGLP